MNKDIIKNKLKQCFSFKISDNKIKIIFLGIHISKKCFYVSPKSCQIQIQKLVKKKLKKVKNNEKIKVYFVIYEKSQWTFQSLYDAMAKDEMFEPYVLIFPAWVRNIEQNTNSNDDLIKFVKDLGLKYVTALDYNNLPDIMFTTLPEYKNMQLDIKSLYKKILFCFHIYGWLLTNDDKVYYANDNFKYFWKEFVPSFRDYEAASKDGPTKGANVICSGYLKNDSFYNAKKTSEMWKNKDSKKIIYAPHYSLYKGGHSLATFDLYYDKIYNYLVNHPEIEIVLKPHPLLRKFIGDKKFQKIFNNTDLDFMTLEEYDEYIEKWNNLPNGIVMNSGDYYELFNSSDAIILDSESFVAEYMIQNKPMLFLNKYDSVETIKSFMNSMGKGLFDAMDVAQSWNDIEQFIENLNKNIDNKKQKREEMIKTFLDLNKRKVGEIIKENIKQSLQ